MIRTFIKDIVEEKNGFNFDRPHRLGEESLSVLVPVVRRTEEKRNYITFAEAKNVKIKDTGNIDFVNVQNNENVPLYINKGAIFKGDTQERAAVHGHIIKPNSNLNVGVRCIHKTKGINQSSDMEYGGITPYTIDLSKQISTGDSVETYVMNCTANLNAYTSSHIAQDNCEAITSGNTTEVPNVANTSYSDDCAATLTVSSLCNDNESISGNNESDNLVNALENMSENLKEAMQNIPFIENQVGGIFLQGSGKIVGLDIYDIPKSWQSIKNDMIKKEGASFIDDDDDLFVMRPEKASKNISKKLSREFTEKIIYSKEYSVVGIKYEDLVGEAIILDNKVIHLTLWSK